MNKSRKILLLLGFACFGHVTPTLARSTDTTHTQSNAAVLEKMQKIVKLYEKQRYTNVLELIEELLPVVKCKADRLQLQFYEAYANYYEKNYSISSNQFHFLTEQYSLDPQIEEAFFMAGYSLAFENVDIYLDQTVTYDAIHLLEEYLEMYPEGHYLDLAHIALKTLHHRLISKSFKEAACYVRLGYYHAAIVALENFEKTYPNSGFELKTYALLLKSYKERAKTVSNEQEKKQIIDRMLDLSKWHSAYMHDTDKGMVLKKKKGMENNTGLAMLPHMPKYFKK
ncbi:outer membrane protein assembly factor BamD [Cardinium endosymbiont of Culicoides punctatus]|uniref:outer membrane protein assembly factor BamD n=1 Tax=Cardinium endosymbiont of Culicoides punctatus TaxID=2304601 RepID=UPI001058C367|nr:outer membrane protein assembly factor BamD [Cardinium endosymbiont of Culicoides punctatus]TDG94990.1 hypothetical protein CCPUN_06460 [Cardinium endosymbiont of Culicoides punctatus]